MMKSNNNNDAKGRRGSSPPFQDTGQGSEGLGMPFQSIGQNKERPSPIQLAMQLGFDKTHSNDLMDGSRRPRKSDPEQELISDGRLRQDKDEVLRWQDDGGEGGEVV
jgi:hypothetical protein